MIKKDNKSTRKSFHILKITFYFKCHLAKNMYSLWKYARHLAIKHSCGTEKTSTHWVSFLWIDGEKWQNINYKIK